ncbi:MAG: LysE family transporter [Kutzneria sp.]|nr:LysE family transporter [Kutzneria sp.]
MIAAAVAGLLAGYGIAVPVGAVAVYLVTLTARTSLTIGISAALGVATVDGGYALFAVLGGTMLRTVIEPIVIPLRLVSALVLIAIAVRVGVTALRHHRGGRVGSTASRPATALRAYASLVGMAAANPATVIYFVALVLSSRITTASTADTAAFVLGAFTASASWQLLVAGGGALLGWSITGTRGRMITAVTSSILIIMLAATMLVGR